MSNPKLEFYKFKLKPKSATFKSFRDFAVEELKFSYENSDEECLKHNFKHFISSFETDYAKDDKLKKCLKIDGNVDTNEHLDKKPTFHLQSFIIEGVINGGSFGKKRILANVDKIEEKSEKLSDRKGVLSYYYIYIYLPSEHNEGLFMIHSSGGEDNITNIFRKFIENLFKGQNYNRASITIFCPKYFQDEFKEGAILKSMSFNTTIDTDSYITEHENITVEEFDVKIEIIPKAKKNKIPVSDALYWKKILSKLSFNGSDKSKNLEEFNRTTIQTENKETNSTKKFEWSSIDNEFIPVVYLKDRIQDWDLNDTGLPDFKQLKDFCDELFENQIKKEVRPDLYVAKIE